ncbi:rubrerythrin-like domain-containing protein [Halorubrum sp. CBA1229]|uniref:rubrerythrin-like domain-containing protein n=1 Tax=Halorubrum sp. CBA1229 TaxID=1853699 RepID=UPI000F3DEC3B|nr:rubrerythrin-like domain-containing protein [Halorubrum sp. CBA1229]QKY17738.1 rubrerythrin-like domain-containing protein [Halorubrum sp. CBA1229]
MTEDTVLSEEEAYEYDSANTYECEVCGGRTRADRSPGDCPECGGDLRNISTSREQ